MFGRALTSVLWGMIADRYGRKPVIMFGTMAVLVHFLVLISLIIVYWLTCERGNRIFIYYSHSILCILMNDYPRIIFNTLFGLSTTFWMAVSTRFLLGSLCCILGPMRVCLLFWISKFSSRFGLTIVFVFVYWFVECLQVSMFNDSSSGMMFWCIDMSREDQDGCSQVCQFLEFMSIVIMLYDLLSHTNSGFSPTWCDLVD